MGVWKKVVAKLGTKWEMQSLNGRHGPNFWRNFWKRSFLAWVTDDQSLVPNRGKIATFLHHPSLFLAFTVFTSSVYFFWSFPFKPPLKHLDSSFKLTQLNFLSSNIECTFGFFHIHSYVYSHFHGLTPCYQLHKWVMELTNQLLLQCSVKRVLLSLSQYLRISFNI